MGKLEKVERRLRAVELLRFLKGNMSYKRLAKLTGLQIPMLNRYIRGKALPSIEKAEEILKLEPKVTDLISSKVSFDERGYLNNTEIIYDPYVLSKITEVVKAWFGEKVDRILTVATDGIPLATSIALALNCKLAFAKELMEPGVEKFYTETVDFGFLRVIHLPRNLLRKGERVLIVDDIIRSGSQIRALARITQRARARVVGVFGIFAIGKEYKKLRKRLKVPVKVLFEVKGRGVKAVEKI